MTILFCILKSILGYFILMLIGTNLLGIVVRGMVPSLIKDEHGNFQSIEEIYSLGGIVITIISSLIGILFIYALYHYWNIGIAIAGVLLMISRLPDLLYEIKTGEKISFKNMHKRPIDIVCNLLSWGALPLIWYSLCYLS